MEWKHYFESFSFWILTPASIGIGTISTCVFLRETDLPSRNEVSLDLLAYDLFSIYDVLLFLPPAVPTLIKLMASYSRMAAFHNNNKQNDRTISCAGELMNIPSSGAASAHANQKKKPYRARGCRGGASRKGRKKQTPTSDSRQDEENDPNRLNNNRGQRRHNNDSFARMRHYRPYNASDVRDNETESSISCGSNESKSSTQLYSPRKSSYGSTSKIHKEFSGSASEEDIEVELLDRSQNRPHYGRETRPILPARDDDTSSVLLAANANGLNSIPAVSMPEKIVDDRDGQTTGGGFSFFCISPCSFLSGQRKKMERTPF